MNKIARTHRISPELDSQIQNTAKIQNKSRSGVVRDALTTYLKNLEK